MPLNLCKQFDTKGQHGNSMHAVQHSFFIGRLGWSKKSSSSFSHLALCGTFLAAASMHESVAESQSLPLVLSHLVGERWTCTLVITTVSRIAANMPKPEGL